MSENSDALKRGYEAFNKGDIDTVRELFEEDIRWEGVNTPDLPMSGVHEGRDAVLQALGQIGEAFERYNVSPDEMSSRAKRSSASRTSTRRPSPLTTSSCRASRSGG